MYGFTDTLNSINPLQNQRLQGPSNGGEGGGVLLRLYYHHRFAEAQEIDSDEEDKEFETESKGESDGE